MKKRLTFSGYLGVVMMTALALACQNAGEGRVLGITSSGLVNGLVFLDRNGNHVLDAGDTALANLPVRLLAKGTRDTAARGSSNSGGQFRFSAIPVGSYAVVIDTTILGDSLRVTRVDTSAVTIRPDDTLAIRITVAFPELTVAQARVAPSGKKMFVVGVALISRGLFGDSTVNISDTASAIRLTNVRTQFVVTGDSLRVLGTRATRDGQPTIDRGNIFTLSINADPPLRAAKTGTASSADGGKLDAALVRVLNAAITDTATVPSSPTGNISGGRRLMVNDSSGAFEVRLDTLVGFKGAALAGDTVGARFDILGILVPIGSGTWRLKPRSPSDMVPR
jgi:hypothetical protein